MFYHVLFPSVHSSSWRGCWTALDRTARSHSLNVKLGALGAAWSVGTGLLGQLELEYSVGQLELRQFKS
jgi:hypothetical protein